MHILFALLVACSGDDADPKNTTDSDTDSETDTDTGSTATTAPPTGDTSPVTETGTAPTGSTATTATTGTTGDTGLGIDLTDRAYRFVPNALSIGSPTLPGISLPDTVFLIKIIAHDRAAETIDLRVASWDRYRSLQDFCSPTTDILGIDLSTAPTVTFGPLDGTFSLSGAPMPAEGATASLTFDAAFEQVVDSSLEALVDLGPSITAYGIDPAYYCSIIASYGTSCTTCPGSGASTCVPYVGTGARARWETSLIVVERTSADILADPACP